MLPSYPAVLQKRKINDIGVEGFYNTIQKEKRIIDTVSPVTRRHKMVFHERAIRDDRKCCIRYTPEKRTIVSCLYQMANITYDRQSLAKDDRVDALAGVVQHLSDCIAKDDDKANELREQEQAMEFYRNPMGYKNYGGKKYNEWNNLHKYSRVTRKHRW